MEQILIKITGRVQGVWFRAYAQEEADKLNISGYAKNLLDGSVEILAQGEKENLEKLIEWTKQGSPSAKVEKVYLEKQKTTKTYNTFVIL